ncbi:acetate kinase [Rothia sp. AR01]|uniref:Acetate kinase n=1 Tax=Rothia santali TaxID=2949643 RepID=A0A9X2HKF0_9MICC|nr:acetate kinase [Rothia santali]MCP3425893.1 acetate kinase [Rothia santali]
MLVLVINSGSSSIKYQVREVTGAPAGSAADAAAAQVAGVEDAILTKGLIENIGSSGAVADHAEALDLLAARLDEELNGREIDVVGHRVVHGGERFSEPVLIDNEIVRTIERLAPLAPLHNPAAALGIRAIQKKWPHLPQVAVFDTAFHRTLPERAWRYAIPDELYRLRGIRRYGFHGTSHDYVTGRAAEHLGVPREELDGVVAHLGNGASVTAIKGGASVDTSMGYTPLAGLVMGTRSGDVDPSVLTALMTGPDAYDAEQIDRVLNNESGLLAIGGSNDMRELVQRAEGGDEKARLALEMAAYRLVKYIGGYHVAVGGARVLIFTAGIGENSAPFRRLVVEGLGALGVTLDEEANAVRSDEIREISGPDSAITVLVVPTDEERAIAEAAVGLAGDRG